VRFDNFHLHLGSAWRKVEARGERAAVFASGERFLFDYIIAGTGYQVDPLAMPELKGFSASIATWGDRFRPREEEKDEILARYPYLGDAYQFTEKTAGTTTFLRNLHCFNFGAMVSYGRHIGDVGSLRSGIARLVSGISRDLFLEEHARRNLPLNVITELTGDEYAHSVWPAGAVARHASA
jgi:cation diffusion facilitator CzcD-associated flavoprotein CzcO